MRGGWHQQVEVFDRYVTATTKKIVLSGNKENPRSRSLYTT
jgi:hypothetical protein